MTVLPITVVIPVYNREQSLPDALRSIERQQEYSVTEVIVVDDHSSDGSVEVARRMGYEPVCLARNGGAAAARNVGIVRCQTEWIAFLDSDDTWEPHLLRTLWPRTAGRVLVSGSAYLRAGDAMVSLIGAEPPGMALRSPLDVLEPENRIVNSSTLVRHDVVKAVGGFDTTWRYSEDLHMWLRVLEHGEGWCDATPTITYHRGPTSKSQHHRGVTEARKGIVHSFAERPWWQQRTADRFLGGIYWDATRTALRGRQWSIALGHVREIVSRPDRVAGVAAGVARHRRLRRRLSGLMSAGAPGT